MYDRASRILYTLFALLALLVGTIRIMDFEVTAFGA